MTDIADDLRAMLKTGQRVSGEVLLVKFGGPPTGSVKAADLEPEQIASFAMKCNWFPLPKRDTDGL